MIKKITVFFFSDKKGADILQKVKVNIYDNLGSYLKFDGSVYYHTQDGTFFLIEKFLQMLLSLSSLSRLPTSLSSQVQDYDSEMASLCRK